MKNLIYKFSVVLLLSITFVSCEEDPLIYDVDNGQTLAEFSSASGTIPVAEEGGSTTVEVAVSTRSSSERVIDVEIDEENTTATPDQYQISDLVIPANSFVGTITISTDFESIPETGSEFLTLNLVGIGDSEATITHGTFEVEMFRWCTTTLDEYVGTWSGTGSWSEHFGYTTEVETFLNEEGELMMNGLAFQWFEGWWGEVIVSNQPVKLEVDLETGEIIIPEQPYIESTWEGAPQPAYSIRGTGMILNSCEKTLQINPVLVQDGSAINGTTWGVAFKETITLDTGGSEEPTVPEEDEDDETSEEEEDNDDETNEEEGGQEA